VIYWLEWCWCNLYRLSGPWWCTFTPPGSTYFTHRVQQQGRQSIGPIETLRRAAILCLTKGKVIGGRYNANDRPTLPHWLVSIVIYLNNEHNVCYHITLHLVTCNILHPFQHGFQAEIISIITQVCAKASRTLCFLCRNLRNCPQKLRELAYTSMCRSVLEYASPIWDPYLQRDIDSL